VKIGPELAEQDLARLKLKFVALQSVGDAPLRQSDAPLRHVFECDIRCARFDLVGLNATARVLGHVAERVHRPALWDLAELGLHKAGGEEVGDGFGNVGVAAFGLGADKIEVDEPRLEQRLGESRKRLLRLSRARNQRQTGIYVA
jgi:hypothetical protein